MTVNDHGLIHGSCLLLTVAFPPAFEHLALSGGVRYIRAWGLHLNCPSLVSFAIATYHSKGLQLMAMNLQGDDILDEILLSCIMKDELRGPSRRFTATLEMAENSIIPTELHKCFICRKRIPGRHETAASGVHLWMNTVETT